ncbi:MAG: AAA family ATPase [Gemmatimonadaceae bacterium]
MELLERAEEIAILVAGIDAAAQGAGSVALVSGEAGVGKTSLVSNFTERVANSARVRWGARDPLLTPRPLGPLHDIAATLGRGSSLRSAVREDAKRFSAPPSTSWPAARELRSSSSKMRTRRTKPRSTCSDSLGDVSHVSHPCSS